jgi:MFS transporter, DHA3 family, multidrug efflux protein
MSNQKLFSHILTNTAIAGFTNMLLWFALTFWAFLTTHSVAVTGVLGGIYMVMNLFGGIWFGSLVDHHRKRDIMLVSSGISLVFYAIAALMFLLMPSETWQDMWSVGFWAFILVCMA